MSSHQGNATGLPVIHDRAAGIDVGSRFHVVAVVQISARSPCRRFRPSRVIFSVWPTGS